MPSNPPRKFQRHSRKFFEGSATCPVFGHVTRAHSPSCRQEQFQYLRRSSRGGFQRFRGEGFSLVEIMVVLVIIGLLAGLVGVNVRGYLVKAKLNAATAEIATICDAIEAYYTEYDRYPSNEEGLVVLTEPSERLPEALLDREPLDPWGRSYVYNQPGREGPYEVLSLGADGREGGEANTADADVGSWDLGRRKGDAL